MSKAQFFAANPALDFLFRHCGPLPVARGTPGCGGLVQGVKVRDVIRLIEQDGWRQVRHRGSHRHYRHRVKPGTVTIAGNPGTEVPPGTLSKIFKQAGLK